MALEEEGACEAQNWRDTVSPQLLATLSPKEVDRQAVIYGTNQKNKRHKQAMVFGASSLKTCTWCSLSPSELYTTEVSHLRTLRVLDQVFYQKMRLVLNATELACIFPNLPQVYDLHGQTAAFSHCPKVISAAVESDTGPSLSLRDLAYDHFVAHCPGETRMELGEYMTLIRLHY